MKTVTIDLYRDATFLREFRITDDEGEPIDLTAYTLDCPTVDQPGGAIALTDGVVTKIEATDGRLNVQFDGNDYGAFGDIQQPTTAFARLRMTAAGVTTDLVNIYLNLLPGT